MIDLGQQYMESGFFLEGGELPDFVPVFLEYASCLPSSEAKEMLGQPAHVFAALAERLDKRESDYSAIFHCLVALAKHTELVTIMDPSIRRPAVNRDDFFRNRNGLLSLANLHQ